MSIGPDTGYAATGMPHANASINTIPNVSVKLGKTKTSELATIFASSLPNFSPRNICVGCKSESDVFLFMNGFCDNCMTDIKASNLTLSNILESLSHIYLVQRPQ